jgi:hypothetical protein
VIRWTVVDETHLVATAAREGDVIVLTCTGSAESDARGELAATLEEIHSSAVKTPTHEVIADIRDLSFASTPCLKAFLGWLQRVQELEDDQRYRVRFRSNPSHMWQRRSLAALRAFASGVVEIETVVDIAPDPEIIS